jgi:hypothetical protein
MTASQEHAVCGCLLGVGRSLDNKQFSMQTTPPEAAECSQSEFFPAF